MESRLKLRLEAARLAAQLSPSSAADLVKKSKVIETYLLGKAKLPEHVSEEDVVDLTVSKGLEAVKAKEDAENNSRWRKMEEEYKKAVEELHKTETCLGTISKGNMPSFGTDKQLHLQDDVELNPFLPDPPFSQTMLELTRDMPDHRFHVTAPGGMPSAEGESIFLQQDGEKVE